MMFLSHIVEYEDREADPYDVGGYLADTQHVEASIPGLCSVWYRTVSYVLLFLRGLRPRRAFHSAWLAFRN